MQNEIRHRATLKVRGTLNEELLLLVETGIEAIGLGRPRFWLLRPDSSVGLWHAILSFTSVR
jgi:hypothetical protein